MKTVNSKVVVYYTVNLSIEINHTGLMGQSELLHNLYPTSILICCMPSGQKIASIFLKNLRKASHRLSMAKYTTEIQSQQDSNPVLTNDTQ